MNAPIDQSYQWEQQVKNWRENHKHEVVNLGPIYPAALSGGFDPAKFTPENMVDFERPGTEE